ncbi:MAG: hypothetical protein KGL39_09165 [Patescibacteria group bacterium]|nr:hypothetical protein [Patescibacteria group bacterium]
MIDEIHVDTRPHRSQRYDTVGDWRIDAAAEILWVDVSRLRDWRMGMCTAVHEIIEALLCHNDGVAEQDVSTFDVAYERARWAGVAAPCGCVPTADSEPGEDRHAPYRSQHAFADGIERLLADRLGLSWSEYSQRVGALSYPEEPV